MHRGWFLRTLATALMLVAAAHAMADTRAGAPGSTPGPSPALDPAAVVRIQLEALAHVDQPVRDAGIAIVFSFASPGNQAQTGPLKHFAEILRKGYPEMLNHRSATLLPTVMNGAQALQGVELIDSAGIAHRYIFILSRQSEAPYAGCWMTDSVINNPDEPKRQEI